MKKTVIEILIILITLSLLIFALNLWLAKALETPVIDWTKTYGGTDSEVAVCVLRTSDGGYALIGSTSSFGAGDSDFWLVKTDAAGNHLWNQTYGGTDTDVGQLGIETSDGGYALTGYTRSFGAGGWDAWLVKTDAAGNHLWNQTYGGTRRDFGTAVRETTDGGYAVAGQTRTFGAGDSDFWLIKTDATGNAIWNQTYGGPNADIASSLVQTGDGGYALTGYTTSFGDGNRDFWLVKTDAAGNHLWNQTYGGTGEDWDWSFIQTNDGGYALVGSTNSSGAGGDDFWLVKTDAAGNHLWNQTYGGTLGETAFSLIQTLDDGYVLAGYTYSYGVANGDLWLIKTNAVGTIEWNITYGGDGAETASDVIQMSDGEFVLAGFTDSFGAGNNDFWLIKLSEIQPPPIGVPEFSIAMPVITSLSIALYLIVERRIRSK